MTLNADEVPDGFVVEDKRRLFYRPSWYARCFRCDKVVSKYDWSPADAAACLDEHIRRVHNDGEDRG